MHDYQYLGEWGGEGMERREKEGGRRDEGRRETAKGGRKGGEESMFAGRLLG